jgi:hypothetical protein
MLLQYISEDSDPGDFFFFYSSNLAHANSVKKITDIVIPNHIKISLTTHWPRTWAVLQKSSRDRCSGFSVLGAGGQEVFYPGTWVAV